MSSQCERDDILLLRAEVGYFSTTKGQIPKDELVIQMLDVVMRDPVDRDCSEHLCTQSFGPS